MKIQPNLRFATRALALFATSVMMACIATSAQAGSYVVSYSGGSVTSNSSSTRSGPFYIDPYGFYYNQVMVGWGIQVVNGVTSVTSTSVTVGGKITATFTWQSHNLTTDLPPTSVVIYEEEHASSTGGSTNPKAIPTEATCSDDLGFAFVPTPITGTNPSGSTGGTAGGIRYQIKENPGMSFTLTASPSATLAGTGAVGPPIGPSGNGGGGSIRVGYKATAMPLELVLYGGLGDKNHKSFLVGQQVTGVLLTGGLTATSSNWFVDGGEPFRSWAPTQSPGVATTFVGYAGDTARQTSFCFRKSTGAQSTVSCSLSLAVPLGALPVGGFAPTLTRQCTVDKPSSTLAVYIGTVQGITGNRTPSPIPYAMQLLGANDPNASSSNSGILWDGTVTTPDGYNYNGSGGWNYTQLIAPHRLVQIGGVDYNPRFDRRQVLDGSFGYASVAEPNLYGADGTQNYEGDSPSQGFHGGSYAEVLDSFVTYTLYKPPGSGSQYVPLKSLQWFWQGQAKPDKSGVYQLSNTNAQWSFVDDFPKHPMWSETESGDIPFSPPLP